MSVFSEKLRSAIEESGIPIASLAEQSGLSISMLYKIQSGARQVDSLETLETLLDAMACSIPRRRELLSYYKIERIGMARYEYFTEFKAMVDDIGALHADIRELTAPEKLNLPSTITGSKNVNAAIATVVNREALRNGGHIDMMIPLRHSYSLDCVAQALSGCAPDFRGVTHLFCLKASGTDDATLYNMRAIRTMIPRMLNLARYDIRYGYVEEPDDAVTPFPFFFITSEAVLLLNGRMDAAVFLQDMETCFAFRKGFRLASQQFKSVLHTGSGDVMNFFMAHQQIVGSLKKHPVVVAVGAQPSVLPCLAPDCVGKYVPPELLQDPSLAAGLEAFFRNSAEKGYITFFTMEGLHHLVDTGEIMEMVGPQIPRLRREDILDALEELIRRAKQGNVIPYMFREDLFRGFSRISIGLYDTKLFVGCEIPGRTEVFSDITEATLARVVREYTDNALLLGDVFPPEETIRILEQELRHFRENGPPPATIPL